MTVDLTRHRHEFLQQGLSRNELDENPFKQFDHWFKQADELGVLEPSAMSLATSDGVNVGVRTVLLKFFNEQGFVFFTNYESKKSKHIAVNPQAALLFPWLSLERQVKITGRVEKVSQLDSLKYFASRPKGSQIGAWASEQSSHLSSRQMLMGQFEAMRAKFAKGEVPLPDFWGGYRVIPNSIEFWQGRENRLHDRFIYEKSGNEWVISRLAP
ncbi:MAG: pyridoxamine 5'-phosphate oxidase [Cycloclasticus sp.]|jgi:pyridoxamine 5'-phosphate oxidase|nr:pyridoxamine 5'-phosphate oxidase [Cycloclasticus sp.]